MSIMSEAMRQAKPIRKKKRKPVTAVKVEGNKPAPKSLSLKLPAPDH